MSDKNLRWIGEGVLSLVKGKELSYGDVIPEGFDKKRLAVLIKQKKVGEVISAKAENANDKLKEQVEALGKEVKTLTTEKEDLITNNEALSEEVKTLTTANEKLGEEVTKLKKQVSKAGK